MSETAQDNVPITIPPPKPLISNDLIDKVVNNIIIPVAIKEAKNSLGINTHEKVNTKSPFARTMLSLKDTWQGTWWTIPALILSLGLVMILLKVLAHWFGVEL